MERYILTITHRIHITVKSHTEAKLRNPCGSPGNISSDTGLFRFFSLLANITQSSRQGSNTTVWKNRIILVSSYLAYSHQNQITKIFVWGNWLNTSSVAQYGDMWESFGTSKMNSSEGLRAISASRLLWNSDCDPLVAIGFEVVIALNVEDTRFTRLLATLDTLKAKEGG